MIPPTPAEERDQRLAKLLADLSEQRRRGQALDINAVAIQHPDLADELRELWGAVLLAEEFANPLSGGRKPPEPTLKGLMPPVQNFAPQTSQRFGDYELLEEIGRGGMGMVYKAHQRSLNRTVALKMILRGELATAEDRTRFRTEARAAAALAHPNIVPVYEAGEHEGQAYFSMRFVEGQTLAALLARGPMRRHRQAQRRSLDREQPIVPAVLADHSSYELAGQLIDPELTPASEAIRRELQRRLDTAIADLDEDDREIILLRHRELQSNQDVARALGLSEAAASMRYLRAVRRLRDALLPATQSGDAQTS